MKVLVIKGAMAIRLIAVLIHGTMVILMKAVPEKIVYDLTIKWRVILGKVMSIISLETITKA